MIKAYCHAPNDNLLGLLDESNEPLETIIKQYLEAWHEGTPGPQLFWFTNEDNQTLATAFRGASDDNIAVVTYANGTVERFQCVYHLDKDGTFDHVTVTPI